MYTKGMAQMAMYPQEPLISAKNQRIHVRILRRRQQGPHPSHRIKVCLQLRLQPRERFRGEVHGRHAALIPNGKGASKGKFGVPWLKPWDRQERFFPNTRSMSSPFRLRVPSFLQHISSHCVRSPAGFLLDLPVSRSRGVEPAYSSRWSSSRKAQRFKPKHEHDNQAGRTRSKEVASFR